MVTTLPAPPLSISYFVWNFFYEQDAIKKNKVCSTSKVKQKKSGTGERKMYI